MAAPRRLLRTRAHPISVVPELPYGVITFTGNLHFTSVKGVKVAAQIACRTRNSNELKGVGFNDGSGGGGWYCGAATE